jgi:hypothetical protein
MPKLNNPNKQEKELVKCIINEILRTRLSKSSSAKSKLFSEWEEEDCYSQELEEFFEDEYDDIIDFDEDCDEKIYFLEIFLTKGNERFLIERWLIKNFEKNKLK